MQLIFHRKTTSILFVTSILVVLILVCMLLVSLTQLSSLNAQAEALHEWIQQAQNDVDAKNELLEYMQSNDYVRKWAEANGRISDEDVQWLDSNMK